MQVNVNKTEIVVFRSSTKQIYKNLNFRLSGQKIEPKCCTKYLGVVIIDEHLLINEYNEYTLSHTLSIHCHKEFHLKC